MFRSPLAVGSRVGSCLAEAWLLLLSSRRVQPLDQQPAVYLTGHDVHDLLGGNGVSAGKVCEAAVTWFVVALPRKTVIMRKDLAPRGLKFTLAHRHGALCR